MNPPSFGRHTGATPGSPGRDPGEGVMHSFIHDSFRLYVYNVWSEPDVQLVVSMVDGRP